MTLDDLPRTNHARVTYAARLRRMGDLALLEQANHLHKLMGDCTKRGYLPDERADALGPTLHLVKQERGRRNPGLARLWSLPLTA